MHGDVHELRGEGFMGKRGLLHLAHEFPWEREPGRGYQHDWHPDLAVCGVRLHQSTVPRVNSASLLALVTNAKCHRRGSFDLE